MTDQQKRAYEWAINQNYQSVAAQYAKTLAEAITALTAEVARLKQKLDKAVGDMNVMALAMRENDELSEGCCFACICDGANLPEGAILPYGECPGYERNDCFEWRGDAAEDKEDT